MMDNSSFHLARSECLVTVDKERTTQVALRNLYADRAVPVWFSFKNDDHQIANSISCCFDTRPLFLNGA